MMKRSLFFPVLLIAALLSGNSPAGIQKASASRNAALPYYITRLVDNAGTASPTPGIWRCYPDGTPDPCHSGLYDVALLSPDNGWAVGDAILRWDGRQWTKDSSWPAGSFLSVAVSSPSDAWAAGYGGVIHWDGNDW